MASEIFAANEPVSFITSGSSTYTSTRAGTYDTDMARNSLFLYSTRRLEAAFDSAQSTFWYQGRYWFEDGDTGNHDDEIITFQDGTTEVLRIILTNAEIRVQRNDGTWTQIVDTNTTFATATIQRLTIRIVLHSSAGSFEMWLDEQKIADFSGDTVGAGSPEVSTCDTVVLTASDQSASFTNTEQYVSEVIVDTQDPRAKRVVTLTPTDNGSNTDWTGGGSPPGSNSVDELETDDSDIISSATAEEVETFTTGNLPAAVSTYTVSELRVTARACRGSTGPQNLQLALQSNTASPETTFFSETKSLGLSFAAVVGVFPSDPDEGSPGVPWENADIDAIEIGVKSIT